MQCSTSRVTGRSQIIVQKGATFTADGLYKFEELSAAAVVTRKGTLLDGTVALHDVRVLSNRLETGGA